MWAQITQIVATPVGRAVLLLLTIALTAAWSLGLSLLLGVALLNIVRKRLLFWLLPLLNVAMVVAGILLHEGGHLPLTHWPWPALAYVSLLVATWLAAWVAWMVLWPVQQVALHVRRADTPTRSAPEMAMDAGRVFAESRQRAGGAFRVGLTTPLIGLNFLRRQRSLWRHLVWPVLISFGLTAGVLIVFLLLTSAVVGRLDGLFGAEWYGRILEFLTALVASGLILMLAVVVFLMLHKACCGFFYARLAAAVERLLGTPETELTELSLGFEIADTLRDVGKLMLVNVGLFVLGWIPVLGLVATPLSLWWSGVIVGRDFLDYPLDLRGWRRDRKVEFSRAHAGETLGLGAVAILVQMVPVLGAVLLSGATVGSVLLYQHFTAGITEAMPATASSSA